MEAEARYTYVGAGVLLLIASLVAGVVWLKDVGGRGDFNRYLIHFEQQALDGLEVGATVTLRGIKVGRVEDYALDATRLNRVRVEVRLDRRAPIRTNTLAVVTRNIVTGIAGIALVNPEPAGAPLTEVPPEERYPVIREGRSDLDEIAGRVSEVGDMASITLSNINQLLSEENRDAVMATVRSLRELSAGLNQRLVTVDRTLQQVGAAATAVGAGAARLGQAGERVATVVEHSSEGLDRALAETEKTLAAARGAIDEVARASGTLQAQAVTTARRLEASAVSVDDQLGAALAEMRLSIEAATRVLDQLREPRSALLGPAKAQLGPGEQTP